MAKAQVYLAGERRGIIFDFHLSNKRMSIEGKYPGEEITPESECFWVNLSFKLNNLTYIHAWVIASGTILCFYLGLLKKKSFFELDSKCIDSFVLDIIIFIVVPIVVYILTRIFLQALKAYARDKAKYNLAKEWYDLRKFTPKKK